MAMSEVASRSTATRLLGRQIGVGVLLALILVVLLGGLSFGPARRSGANAAPAKAAAKAAAAKTAATGITASRGLALPNSPSDSDFLRIGRFGDPLVPVKATTAQENRDLARAVTAYDASARNHEPDRVEPLVGFVAAHPDSAWRPGLLVNLGSIYRRTGHFSKALESWELAWQVSKTLDDPNGRMWGDQAVGYLSQFEAYLGRKQLLRPLLEEVAHRSIGGPGGVRVSDSRRGLGDMQASPQESFKCGPLALASILRQTGQSPRPDSLEILNASHSTPNGLSLTAVQEISAQAGMNYQMAFRSSGAAVVVPSVAHWKVGHYSALLSRNGVDRYSVQDQTLGAFGEGIEIREATIDEEASGYFLIPPGPLPAGWRTVDAAEGNAIWGRGDTGTSRDIGANGPLEVPAFPCSKDGGCTAWNVEAMLVGLSLHDDPVGYTPPVGPDMHFRLWYSQLDSVQPSTFNYTNFGPRWTANWVSYIFDPDTVVAGGEPWSSVTSPCTITSSLFRRGGGVESFLFLVPQTTMNGVQVCEPASDVESLSQGLGPFSQSTLQRIYGADGGSSTQTAFLLQHPDGSSETFAQITTGQFNAQPGNLYFLTALTDPQGNSVQIGYDSQTRIQTLTDAVGRVTTLCYSDSTSDLCTPPCGLTPQIPESNLEVTQVLDPFGRSAYFQYDSSGRLTSITDVLCITSSYGYTDANDADTVTSLTTPYGTTTFSYGIPQPSAATSCAQTDRYVQVTEPLGRTSQVESCQDPGNTDAPNLTSACTPTRSAGSMAPCDLTVGTPAKAGQSGGNADASRLSIQFSNCNLQFRNTFIWNPVEYNEALASAESTSTTTVTAGGLDYTKAKLIHWLHTSIFDPTTTSRVVESTKEPLENRIWFNYPGQSALSSACGGELAFAGSNQPINIARVLPDGDSEIWTYGYDSYGHVSGSVDPFGRGTTYTYDPNNHVDLLKIANTTVAQRCCDPACCGFPCPCGGARDDLLATYTYSNHVLTSFMGANGQTTTFTPEPNGEPGTIAPPSPSAPLYFNYPSGATLPESDYVQCISTVAGSCAAANALYSFTYDGFGRFYQVTDASNTTLTYSYDNADRVTQIEFPDGTSITFNYDFPGTSNASLDLQSVTDRVGNTTTFTYDAQRLLTGVNQANLRYTEFAYAGDDPNYLQELLDPRGYTTFFVRDLMGRLTAIEYPSTAPLAPFQWDAVGRLTRDPQATYAYNDDGTLATVTYTTATNPATPSVGYSYDEAYRRVSGVFAPATVNATTSNTVPNGPLPANIFTVTPQIGYSYFSASSPQLGANRVETVTTALGNATADVDAVSYTYNANDLVASRTVAHTANANGSITNQSATESFTYDSLGRLKTDANALDTFTYGYSDSTPRVTSITSGGPSAAFQYGIAQGENLIGNIQYEGSATAVLPGESLVDLSCPSYNPNGQALECGESWEAFAGSNGSVVAELTAEESWSYSYDALNQLSSGDLTYNLNGPLTNYGYTYDPSGNVTPPGEASTQSVSYTATNEIAFDRYDRFGDMTAGEVGAQTVSGTPQGIVDDFTWDAAQRLVSATGSNSSTSVSYDGLGRVVGIADSSPPTTVVANHSFLWCGDQLCMVHDNTNGGAISRRYFAQGFVQGTSGYYYVKDRIGTVRGLFAGPAANSADVSYYYDPYGTRTNPGQSIESDVGFAGYLYDPVSALNFTQHRAYMPFSGRWLSRDPLGMAGGVNQYTYAGNDPINSRDPSGLQAIDPEQAVVLVEELPELATATEEVASGAGEAFLAQVRSALQGGVVPEQFESWAPAGGTPAINAMVAEGSDLAAEATAASVPECAAETVGEAPFSIEAAEITGVQANRILGNAAADELASSLEETGLTVEREVYFDTPYGGRYADLQVSSGDQPLGLVEVKVGDSPYTAAQQLKDAYIQDTYGLPTNLVRYPTYP